jgi:hypothetical protein
MYSFTGRNGTVWGKAEYYDGKNWNEICDNSFSDKNAQVFCRSVGSRYQNAKWMNAS